jgi:hypothetical protein
VLALFDLISSGGSELALSLLHLPKNPNYFVVHQKRKSKMNWQRRFNFFYYEMFKVACFMRISIARILRIVGFERLLTTLSGRRDSILDDQLKVSNDPSNGISLAEAGKCVYLHLFLLLFTLWNIISGFLLLDYRTFWVYGIIAVGILALVLSIYLDRPIDRRKHLKDFKQFDSMSKAKKVWAALLTLVTVLGIWAIFVAGFAFYLRELIKAKPH